jgi:hypothetical protein
MDLMGKITAAIDAAKRTAGKRVSDLVQNPGQFLEQANDQAANYNANVQPTIQGGELTNRPLTPEEIEQKSTDLAMAVMPMGVGHIAYHGSPHKFDKFKSKAIGTGEGAQAYGHGLYLAESPDVAQSYKIGLTNPNQTLWTDIENVLPDVLKGKAADFSDAVLSGKTFDHLVDTVKLPWQKSLLRQQKGALNSIIEKHQSGGNFYKTDIPDEAVGSFIEWENAISKYPKDVQEKVYRFAEAEKLPLQYQRGSLVPNRTGEDLYKNAVSIAGSEQGASELLKKYGIQGIKFSDKGARLPGGKGTSNFTVFDPEMIRILEQNGKSTGAQPWAPGEWNSQIIEAIKSRR